MQGWVRGGKLSTDTQPKREWRYARPPQPDLTYSFLLPPVLFIFNVIFLSDSDIVNILSVLL